MQCRKCGAYVAEGNSFCPVCGENLSQQQMYSGQPQQPMYNGQQQMYNGQQQMYNGQQQMYNGQPQQMRSADTGNFGWGVLGFFFPIVGWILYGCWYNTKPKNAKIAGIAGIVGFIVNIILIASGAVEI